MTQIACNCFFTGPFTFDDRCDVQEESTSLPQLIPLVQRSSDFVTPEDAVELVSNFHRKTRGFSRNDPRSRTVTLTIPKGAATTEAAITLGSSPSLPEVAKSGSVTVSTLQFHCPPFHPDDPCIKTVTVYVTILCNKSIDLIMPGQLKIPHDVKLINPRIAQLCRVSVIKQNATSEGLSGWEKIEETSVSNEGTSLVVTLEQLDEAAVYVGYASSTRALKDVMKTNISFSVLGPHCLKDDMLSYVACCKNAYEPDEIDETLIPWTKAGQSAAVSPGTDLIIHMSTTERGWYFHPVDLQTVQWDSLECSYSSYHLVNFALKRDVKEGSLRSFSCRCHIKEARRIIWDKSLRSVFFETPSQVEDLLQLLPIRYKGA